VSALTSIGLEAVQVTQHFDCFRATSKEKIAHKFGVQGVNIFAHKSEAQGANRRTV
jgi:hypothetical protein